MHSCRLSLLYVVVLLGFLLARVGMAIDSATTVMRTPAGNEDTSRLLEGIWGKLP